MMRTSRVTGFLASLAALSVALGFNAAVANHFILPCTEECDEARWVATGSMATARESHTATLLHNGRVLVAGGRNTEHRALDTAELYDPATGTWSVTGRMTMPRDGHVAALLPDGRVLVAGGFALRNAATTMGFSWEFTNTAEVYDPAAGTWTPTGSMSTPRSGYAAVALTDGRILVAGGWRGGDDPVALLASAELYDPATGIWSPTGGLRNGRYGHTLTLLEDGTVLAVRGSDSGDLQWTLSSAERFDPQAGAWSLTGLFSGANSIFHTATRLPDGRLLVAGGYSGGPVVEQTTHAATNLFDATTGTWSRAGDMGQSRYSHAAAVLSGGEVLVAGGVLSTEGVFPVRYTSLSVTERFDPVAMTWTRGADLIAPRMHFTLTPLPDGTVLAVGGSVVEPDYRSTPLATAERYAARPKGGSGNP